MKDIVLIGGGGHCSSCIDVIENEGKFRIIGLLDLPENIGNTVSGYPVIGTDDALAEISKTVKHFLVTIGHIKSVVQRIDAFNAVISSGGRLPVIISPIAYVSKSASIGPGTIVMHHAIINTEAKIGVNCIINTKSLVEHNAEVGDHCHISTASVINGGVKIGQCSFFGSGSISKQYITIPPNSFIKAQSLVV